jgi:hypothetical protein
LSALSAGKDKGPSIDKKKSSITHKKQNKKIYPETSILKNKEMTHWPWKKMKDSKQNLKCQASHHSTTELNYDNQIESVSINREKHLFTSILFFAQKMKTNLNH